MILSPYIIRYGYSQGLFPMGDDNGEVNWYEPKVRAVFPLEGIHVSLSLSRKLRRTSFQWVGAKPTTEMEYDVRFDTSFEQVMRSCLRPKENWITEEIIRAFTLVHSEGWGHCAEVWRNGELVGGAYGIALGTCFCAESMFHRVTDASKIALWAMVEQCRRLGFTIFDAQVMNPHLESIGALPMTQSQFLRILPEALDGNTIWS